MGGESFRVKQKNMTLPLTVTEAAKARIVELTAAKDGAAGVVLRIAKGKGCGGNEYRMEYMQDVAQPGFDRIDVGAGAALFIPMTDSLYMFGMQIDFETDNLSNSRFLFTNPNEAGRCGCGESFSLDPNQKMDESGACGVE